MAASPFCTPCSSRSPSSSSSPPPSPGSTSITPFSTSIPLRQPSGDRSFSNALCSGPAFAHINGFKSNAFCHPIPESFAGYSGGSPLDSGEIEVKKPTIYNGMPCIFLTNDELDLLDKPLELSLIAKFPAGRPKWQLLHSHFREMKLLGDFKINHYDSKHVVIHFKHPEDYTKIFAKPVTIILGFAVKFLKWTRDFDVFCEPAITPIWISLPNLCMNFFTRNILLSIASAFGKPLLLDSDTANGVRPINARILVELNVLKKHPDSIWLGNDEFGYSQKVIIENLPKYCDFCCKYGHINEQCFIKDPNLKKTLKEEGEERKTQKAKVQGKQNEKIAENKTTSVVLPQHTSNEVSFGVLEVVDVVENEQEENFHPSENHLQNQKHPDAITNVDSQNKVQGSPHGNETSENSVSRNQADRLHQIQSQDPGINNSTNNLLSILQASSKSDKALLISAINKINWEGLNLEDTAEQIIEMATTKLIEECYQVVFEGNQRDEAISNMQPVDSNATTQGPEDDIMARLTFSPITINSSCPEIAFQDCGLEEEKTANANNDIVWMGLANEKCLDDQDVVYVSSSKKISTPQTKQRRFSWSNESDNAEIEKSKPKKYKKRERPQIQIDKESCRTTRSSKKDAHYYLL